MAAIDREETKNRLFGALKQPKPNASSPEPKKRPKASLPEDEAGPELPKWRTLDKVTVLLTSEQRDGMEDIARKLMRFRSKQDKVGEERERITANTVFRALVENFLDRVDGISLETIQNEEGLKSWLSRLFR